MLSLPTTVMRLPERQSWQNGLVPDTPCGSHGLRWVSMVGQIPWPRLGLEESEMADRAEVYLNAASDGGWRLIASNEQIIAIDGHQG